MPCLYLEFVKHCGKENVRIWALMVGAELVDKNNSPRGGQEDNR
jgi:hypothetical protein